MQNNVYAKHDYIQHYMWLVRYSFSATFTFGSKQHIELID